MAREKGIKLLRTLFLLDGVCLACCYLLARYGGFFDLPRGDLAVICGGVLLTALLASAWRLAFRPRATGTNMVCDRCNRLKFSDGQLICQCGGEYFPLAEMKWVKRNSPPVPARRLAPGQ
jgi:hypothetical protein